MLKKPYNSLLRRKVEYLLLNWPSSLEREMARQEAAEVMKSWPSFNSVPYTPSSGSEAIFSHALFEGGGLSGTPSYKTVQRFWVDKLISPWSSGYMACPEDEPDRYGSPSNAYGVVGIFWHPDGSYSVQPLILSEQNFRTYLERNELSPLSEEDVSIKCHEENSPYSFRCTGSCRLQEIPHTDALKEEVKIASRDLELFMATPFDLQKLQRLRGNQT
jgi:hypothetical protein